MFDEIRALIGFLQRRSLAIDGPVLSISCRLSSIFMFGGLMVVCSSQLISKPIHCDGVGGKVNQQFLETYCFIYPTYIVAVPDGHHERYPNDPRRNFTGIFPGILPFRPPSLSNPDPLVEVNVHYYQWMWIIYFLEALCFYFPHWLWKTMEGRRIRALVSQADMLVDRDPRCDSAEYRQLIRIANYVANSFGSNGKYMARYYFCELIGFLNLFVQMFILNLIFGGHYFTYGLDALKTLTMAKRDDWRHLNPINKIFPRMTKCEYRRYGPSGASEIIDSLCMLPLNVFNDKFFLFFWFWILLMAFLFLMTFFYRLAEILLPFMRTRFLCDLMKFGDLQTLNETRNLMFRLKLSDWFFLNLIANNVDRIFLSRLLKEIIHCEKIKNPKHCGDDPDQIPMDSLSVHTCSTNACLMDDVHNDNANGSPSHPVTTPGHHHHPSPYPRRSRPFRNHPWNNAPTITTHFESSGKNYETTIF